MHRPRLIVSSAMLFMNLLGLPRAMWAGIACMSVCLPFTEDCIPRSVSRGMFNVVGCLLFIVLYLVLPKSMYPYIGMIGGIGVGYSAGYPWQTAFNTFGALEGQWKITVDSVETTDDRNEYSDKNPAAVYLVTYTYENLGYDDDIMNGLYISLDDGIVDSAGKMGYSYPGDISMYPQETPVGASCQAQACIGVDNAGSFKINFYNYDSNNQKQSAVFEIDV